jgi:hypothetical protein
LYGYFFFSTPIEWFLYIHVVISSQLPLIISLADYMFLRPLPLSAGFLGAFFFWCYPKIWARVFHQCQSLLPSLAVHLTCRIHKLLFVLLSLLFFYFKKFINLPTSFYSFPKKRVWWLCFYMAHTCGSYGPTQFFCHFLG